MMPERRKCIANNPSALLTGMRNNRKGTQMLKADRLGNSVTRELDCPFYYTLGE
jgi:hypothetical protein